jgi:hypothetical protein
MMMSITAIAIATTPAIAIVQRARLESPPLSLLPLLGRSQEDRLPSRLDVHDTDHTPMVGGQLQLKSKSAIHGLSHREEDFQNGR